MGPPASSCTVETRNEFSTWAFPHLLTYYLLLFLEKQYPNWESFDMSLSKPEFLNLGTIAILGGTIVLCFVGSYFVQYKMFSNISGRHPPDTSRRHPPPLNCDNQNSLQMLTSAIGGAKTPPPPI